MWRCYFWLKQLALLTLSRKVLGFNPISDLLSLWSLEALPLSVWVYSKVHRGVNV